MKKFILLVCSVGLYILMVSSCQPVEEIKESDELLNAVLWMQKSAEYKVNCLQAYSFAGKQLQTALEDENWTAALEQTGDYMQLPPAVILDVDETVLDNSAYEARLIRQGVNYSSESWTEWCKEERAEAIPGALGFCQQADKMGITVFYVTNRHERLKEETRRNLQKLGFPLESDMETIETRLESPDKGGRREVIALDYRILLLIGDNLGDFASGFTNAPAETRDSLLTVYQEYFGKKWISLPNPAYGDWESALYEYNYDLTDKQKDYIKKKALDTE